MKILDSNAGAAGLIGRFDLFGLRLLIVVILKERQHRKR